MRFRRKLAQLLAASPLLARGRRLYQANTQNWNIPLTKVDKLAAGSYIILSDYAAGRFPPRFEDQAKAYQGEIDYLEARPGVDQAVELEFALRKPFWGSASFAKYAGEFAELVRVFEQLGLPRTARILELGCGAGWMSEFLALNGYSVVATSLAPAEIALAQRRTESFRAKQLPGSLTYRVAPMESVDAAVADAAPFQAAFVFEALHHAFDWRQTLHAAYRTLAPDGWFLLANEPNVLHTFISYRVARLSNTHEIGMSRPALVAELKKAGFRDIRVLKPRINNWIAAHWIAARR